MIGMLFTIATARTKEWNYPPVLSTSPRPEPLIGDSPGGRCTAHPNLGGGEDMPSPVVFTAFLASWPPSQLGFSTPPVPEVPEGRTSDHMRHHVATSG
ncbi:hypothetical protein CCHR01_17267 [Colletotrichum chrysophilum]|uniref:Uncharacterized protein n=1 Tax=Colletotrichum chrysophilum TaxID=1836956 RepID=A0AAD9ECM2_9PEZI|nr:hypothetical protein K456DRAFT_127572 [Colletotrichum gloeosporioides 23]KAK1840106.1 hypothetical protein CCHR01_17267 [Colletotrichum chrysophilum]